MPTYPIRDDAHALAVINEAWSRDGADIDGLVGAVLGEIAIWGEDLNGVGDLSARTARHLACVERSGIRAAMQQIRAG